jgi:2-keto-3-deoxy-L-arabinonate dehydratase
MVQDHPLSGVPLPAALLARLAREVEQVRYFKIETPRAPVKFGATLALAGERVLGIFGGANGLLFIDELACGGCGTMPSGATPEVFVAVYHAFMNGEREKAETLFRHYLPLIYFEHSLGGKNFPKELLQMGGIIRSAAVRPPVPASWDEPTRQRAQAMARQYDLLVLRSSVVHRSVAAAG